MKNSIILSCISPGFLTRSRALWAVFSRTDLESTELRCSRVSHETSDIRKSKLSALSTIHNSVKT